jgi:hypothetical protein
LATGRTSVPRLPYINPSTPYINPSTPYFGPRIRVKVSDLQSFSESKTLNKTIKTYKTPGGWFFEILIQKRTLRQFDVRSRRRFGAAHLMSLQAQRSCVGDLGGKRTAGFSQCSVRRRGSFMRDQDGAGTEWNGGHRHPRRDLSGHGPRSFSMSHSPDPHSFRPVLSTSRYTGSALRPALGLLPN